MAEGKSNKEIAKELYLSVRAIENTRRRICRKLKISGRGSLEKGDVPLHV
ncbi:MAG: LuxR C-terminal-related transcriptional regulator [Balneolaceae bacterium]